MIKILLVSIFSLIVANLLNGQNHRTLQFVDIVQNKPIYGVMVFTDGNFASVSDDNGNCQIDSNINEIYCKYLGYRDTLINVKDCNHCVISLETNYNLLGEVEVDAKYDEKKHLIKLLNESQVTAYKLDTILYYRFKEINTISELGQTEMFTGILRVENKGYSRGGCIAFVSDISNYYNSTGQDTYELMQTKLMHVSSIITALNSDVLFAKQINRIKKKYDVERPTLFSKDSTSFLVLLKKAMLILNLVILILLTTKSKLEHLLEQIKLMENIVSIISKWSILFFQFLFQKT